MAGANGAVARASRHRSPVTAILSSLTSIITSSLFLHPLVPLSGSSEIWGVGAGERESPGRPPPASLAVFPPHGPTRPPRRGPGLAWLSACGIHRGSTEILARRRGGYGRIGGSGRTGAFGRTWKEGGSCTRARSSPEYLSAPCNSIEWNAPLRIPQQSASTTKNT